MSGFATTQYPSAWEQLRLLGRAAKACGVPFDAFWARAVRPGSPPVTYRVPEEKRPADAIVWPSDHRARKDDQAALNAVKDGWQRAYEDAPPLAREAALPRLSNLLDRIAELGKAEEEDGGAVGEELLSAA